MKFNVNKFRELAKPADSKYVEEALYIKENEDWIMFMIDLVVNARVAMKERKISQAKLAETLGVSPGEISKLLSGKENLTIQTIKKLEKAIGVKLVEVCQQEKKTIAVPELA